MISALPVAFWLPASLAAMACPHCGSWSVKSDRSLAGRLVCGGCGRPLGSGGGKVGKGKARQEANSRSRTPRGGNARRRSGGGGIWWLWLTILLAISAGLAYLQGAPPWAPSFPEIHRRLPKSSEA
jgi:hypothetical protein